MKVEATTRRAHAHERAFLRIIKLKKKDKKLGIKRSKIDYEKFQSIFIIEELSKDITKIISDSQHSFYIRGDFGRII